MIEHLNGQNERIANVLRHRFDSSASLQATPKCFVYLYNHHISQKICSTKHPSKPSNNGTRSSPNFSKKSTQSSRTQQLTTFRP